MKKTLKIIAILSILLFGVLWILSKFMAPNEFNTIDHRNIFVLIYLFTSLKHYQMDIKDKNTTIRELKSQLKEFQS